MTPQTFRSWRKRLHLTQREAGDLLGLSREAIVDIEAGRTPIRRAIALACAAIAQGLPPAP